MFDFKTFHQKMVQFYQSKVPQILNTTVLAADDTNTEVNDFFDSIT